jgi:putative salt-induced outer membrane protein YdiY
LRRGDDVRPTKSRRIVTGLVLALSGVSIGVAADPPARPDRWTDAAEFSFVATAGNSETSTFGFKNTLARAWEKSSFELKAGGVRGESTTKVRAVHPVIPVIEETATTELTAENYFLNGRYDRKITDRFFWYAGAGWDRNRFAGIQNRYSGVGGVGNIWKDEDRVKFRTDYALSYTKQENVVEVAGADDSFLGVRVSSKFLHKLGAVTTYGNDLVMDENLDETSDFRADMTNWVTVSMSARLALKVSLQWLYDNEPSFESIDDPGNLLPPPGVKANAQLDDLDTVFTASLVANF